MSWDGIKENDVIYRCIGDDFNKGILSCGFMRKRTSERSQYQFTIGYYSCFVILRGSGRYITEDGTVIPMQAGDLVQRSPGCLHSTEIEPNGEWIEFYISIGYPVYEYLKSLGILKTDKVVQPTPHKDDMLYEFAALLNNIRGSTDLTLPEMLLKAQEIIIRLHHSVQVVQCEHNESIVNKACQLIGGSNDIHFDIKDAVSALNMGYENFRKLFKERTGVSPHRYHILHLMKQAKMMMLSGCPIKQVAISLGYGDVYSFTKQFTKSEGISPGRYINSRLKEEQL